MSAVWCWARRIPIDPTAIDGEAYIGFFSGAAIAHNLGYLSGAMKRAPARGYIQTLSQRIDHRRRGLVFQRSDYRTSVANYVQLQLDRLRQSHSQGILNQNAILSAIAAKLAQAKSTGDLTQQQNLVTNMNKDGYHVEFYFLSGASFGVAHYPAGRFLWENMDHKPWLEPGLADWGIGHFFDEGTQVHHFAVIAVMASSKSK